MSSENGFNLAGVAGNIIPESILEDILCRLPPQEILKCSLVCQSWKDLLKKKSFWNKCFKYSKKYFKTVPLHVQEKEDGWIAFHAHICYSIFSRNFIENPSEHDKIQGWCETTSHDDDDQWTGEDYPPGFHPLTKRILRRGSSCFVQSCDWCSKYYNIDLRKEGLTSPVLKTCLPLQFTCSQIWKATRVGYGGERRWKLELLDDHQEMILEQRKVIELPAEREQWRFASYKLNFSPENPQILDKVRFLRFTYVGEDTHLWSGHYGMKLIQTSVSLTGLEKYAKTMAAKLNQTEIESGHISNENWLRHYYPDLRSISADDHEDDYECSLTSEKYKVIVTYLKQNSQKGILMNKAK